MGKGFRVLAPPLADLSGEAFVSSAIIGEADVDALPEIVARLGRAVDAELRK